MNETTITDEQRKAFADLIREAQKRDESEFNEYLKSMKDTFTPRFETGSKIRQVIEQIRSFRGKLSEAAEQLRHMGFRVVDDGFVSVDYDVSNQPFRDFEKAKKAAYEDHEAATEQYRKATFDIWSAKTPDEAREIVRRLM
jgi:hypothetical protein